jgi:hypothetical protein
MVGIDEPCAVVFPAAPVIFDSAGVITPPEVLFSLSKFPKVFPPSLLVLITGLSAPVSFVHHVTATLLPDACMFTLLRITETLGFVLGGLRTIAFENVFPPSLLFVKNMASPWRVALALFHAVYMLLPDTATGAALSTRSGTTISDIKICDQEI